MKGWTGFALIFLLVSQAIAFEVSQFGIILGTNYNWLWGANANSMSSYIDSTDFEEGRNPFGHLRNPSKGYSDPEGTFGLTIGLFSRMDINDYFSIRVEANYVWKGAEYQISLDLEDAYPDYIDLDSLADELAVRGDTVQPGFRRLIINNSYIEVPVLVGFNINRELTLFTGPHFSYLLMQSFEAHITESDYQLKDYTSIVGNQSYQNIDPEFTPWDVGVELGASYQISDQIILDARWVGGFNTLLDRSEAVDIKQNTIRVQAAFNFSEF